MRAVSPLFRRIITLFCLAALALGPFRAACAQQGQRLNLIRDAEIENTIRTFVIPIWQVAGLNPEAVSIVLVQDGSLNAFVAGGQRIFINTGLIMRTSRPNQLIGVLAHETGHISGGHLARMHEELSALSTLQILEAILGAGAIAGSAVSGGTMGRGGPMGSTGTGKPPVPGSLLAFLKYTQTQENAADQAAISFLDKTKQSPKGTVEFLRVLEREERVQVGRRDAYLTTHPLTPDRISTFELAAGRSPYVDTPDSPRFVEMHARMVAKLWGFVAPDAALQRYVEGDRAVAPRYARAIALYRKGALGSALLTIDGLLKEYPNDPYFHELRGQMLYENGRANESIPSYKRAVQLNGAGVMKIDYARALLETNTPENDREAIRNLEIARQTEAESFDLWRMLAAGYSRQNNSGMTSLARAEMAVLRGNRSEAQSHAAAAVSQLPRDTPAWHRAEDIKAYINSRPRR
jgi:predicted Zn-dependent protease